MSKPPARKWKVVLPVDEWTRLLFAAQDSDDLRVRQAAEQALPVARVEEVPDAYILYHASAPPAEGDPDV